MKAEEWRSQLENLTPATELRFRPTSGFRPFQRYFCSDSTAHPAKCNLLLLYYLIKKHTKPQETVLDPMAGTSSTGIVASLLGRHSVCVELEEKFCEWSRRNVECLERAGKKRGEIKIVQGDARRLSEILGRADVAITSPPYTNSAAENPNVVQLQKKGWVKGGDLSKFFPKNLSPDNIGNFPFGNVDVAITSPPYAETYVGGGDSEKRKERLVKAGHNPKDFLGGKARNAVLKHYGEVDICLTSPPYSESMTKRRKGYTVIPELAKTREMPQDTRDDNIANLPHGNVDAVITSPPYGEAQEGSGIAKRGYQGSKHSPTDLVGKRSYMPEHFENPENISKLPHGNIDAIVTSPPYEETQSFQDPKFMKSIAQDQKANLESGKIKGHSYSIEARKRAFEKSEQGKIENPQNIGNLKKETYLEAMLQVYSEMFRVLKPNGLAIIIVKPFIRQKRVVDLSWHTWLLMAKVGFALEKLYKLRLKQQSFWRILQYRNNPDLERICHEYVIVAKKPTVA